MAAGAGPSVDVCLVDLEPIRSDPRVRKQGDGLCARGLSVIGLCHRGDGPAPAWPLVEVERGPPPSAGAILRGAARGERRRLAEVGIRLAQPFARFSPALAERVYWSRPWHRALLEAGRAVRAAVYVANDWTTLPIAAALARHHGGQLVYDSHEYAAEELLESPTWRLMKRPVVLAVERRYIGTAALVSTISAEIARQLAQDHRLPRTPLVARNVPWAAAGGARPIAPSEEIVVLYHGVISEPRQLHVVVRSVAQWAPGRRLVLRGDGPADLLDRLRREALSLGLGPRVAFEPAVRQADVVAAARTADMGFVSLPQTSRQNQFALPNKTFEYVHAGLGLIVPQLETLAGLVRGAGIGVVVPRFAPDAVAAVVNALTPDAVLDYRRRSAELAPALVWEREAAAWTAAVAELVAARARPTG